MITFQRISWKNLLSTGNNPTEIDLNTGQTTLIIGENGAGKSTILDALCFALFGKPFRRIKKPSLINSVNGKKLLVELEFSTNGHQYKIVRGIKPNIFEIYQNGVLLNQSSTVRDYQEDLEKFVIKMNYKSFTSIVILGSASFTPFMQLSAADRRTVIEDLLDIQVFSTMNVLVRQRMQENKEQLSINKVEHNATKDKIKYIEDNLSTMSNTTSTKVDTLRKNINDIEREYERTSNSAASLIGNIKKFQFDGDLKMNFLKKQTKFISLKGQIENNKNRLDRELEFYKTNENCSTCKQDIKEDFKVEIMAEKRSLLDECLDGLENIDAKIAKIVDDITEMEENETEIRQIKDEYTRLESHCKYLEAQKSNYLTELTALHDSNELEKKHEDDLAEAKAKLKDLDNTRNLLSDQHSILEITMKLLKDGGIKSKIIKQYLPVINKKVNQYLGALEFFVNFELDENFNETMKARHLDEFSYSNFSEGEKMRIDLALLFTWRTVAKMRNSVHTNLLILDEVFDSSLDGSGTEEFLKIMMTLIGDTNVFVISHKTDQLVDKFDKIVHFEKYKNFSRIKND